MSQDTTTPHTNTLTFAVEGMTCGSCVRHVGQALADNFDHLTHEVDLRTQRLTVSFEPEFVSEEEIVKVMNEAGYPVTRV